MRAELSILESRIDHHFSDPELLRRAMTHSSLANETREASGAVVGDNEQLEFLGDAILGFVVSEALVRRFPGQREGELSRQKAHLVSAAHLYGVARRLDLGAFLALGRGEESTGGRAKKNLLVDGLEALIAAIYLDGGIGAVSRFVEEHVLDGEPAAEEAESGIVPVTGNYKGALLELARAKKLPLPRFNLISEEGPAHARIFTIEVRVGMEWRGQGTGSTKKVAAQRAARIVYERLLHEGAPVV